ncbi:cytochrome c [Cytophagaceae bacterium ABcell3]|nr:cytochrome c [Cytophagaceae bacterium ABcell3]
MRKISKVINASLVFAMVSFFSCSGDDKPASDSGSKKSNTAESTSSTNANPPGSDKGVGPISSVELSDELDADLIAKGESIFNSDCSACHQMDTKVVGPALKGITERRTPEWIMNIILNPVEMTQKDPIAKKLLAEYNVQMVYQDVSEEGARALLEFFRSKDQ